MIFQVETLLKHFFFTIKQQAAWSVIKILLVKKMVDQLRWSLFRISLNFDKLPHLHSIETSSMPSQSDHLCVVIILAIPYAALMTAILEIKLLPSSLANVALLRKSVEICRAICPDQLHNTRLWIYCSQECMGTNITCCWEIIIVVIANDWLLTRIDN